MNVPARPSAATALTLALLCCFAFLTVFAARARERTPAAGKNLSIPSWRYSNADRAHRSHDHDDPDAPAMPLRASAPSDTTVLGAWTFEQGCSNDGWTTVDRTEQLGTFFHVDDFAGLGGGDFGRLAPLAGTQSMWCGLRPAQTQPPLCAYATLPGYGNAWDQLFHTVECLSVTNDVLVDYLIAWDSEPGYDWTVLEYDLCDDNWHFFDGAYDNVGQLMSTSIVDSAWHAGSVRLRFRFTSDGAWSDEDGIFDTDGAVILDSLTVRDAGGVVLATEHFESEAVGATATASGAWIAEGRPGYGDFAAVFPGYSLTQEDPCDRDLSCAWAFIAGSTADYACGGFPNQIVVPYQNMRGQFIWNEVWSPWVPLAGPGVQLELAFDVYRDMPIDPLIFYAWHVRSRVGASCPGLWKDRNIVYYGDDPKQWLRQVESIADLIEPGATEVQVALGVRDMCEFWCGYVGTGACHSHAPLFDNVEVRRIMATGPQWSVRDVDLFQDTFAADGTTTGTARVDAAIDIMPPQNPNIRPGDSTVVMVTDLEVGIAPDAYTGFGPAVYAYVAIANGIDPYPGDAIVDDAFRWPAVDSLVHDGRTWYCLRMDTAFADGTARTAPAENRFCIDLNDELFVPGDTIMFVFGARSNPPGSHETYWSPFTATTSSLTAALDEPAECTILPAAGKQPNGHILYVDGYNGMGAQPFFDTAFEYNGILHEVDRYDIRGPASRAGNHPGARVVDVAQQLLTAYRVIIWNTGDLERGLIGDGNYWNEKSNDAGMLLAFLDNLGGLGGLYLSGDNIATEWLNLAGTAPTLMNTYIQHTLVDRNHADQGIRHSPLVIGDPGGPFDNLALGPDTTHALSLCPDLNEFDVIEPTFWSEQVMHYNGVSTGSDGAVIGQTTTNPLGKSVRVMLSGFSFHSIRDDRAVYWLDRVTILRQILLWLGLNPPVASGTPTEHSNRLAQNYPNPFNPTTIIRFSLRERAHVRLAVYNVRGQLVRILVNEERAPGVEHHVSWDGDNNTGERVASGVYFYRIVTKGFTQARKMVLLK